MFYAFWVFITMAIEQFLVWKYDVASIQMNWFGVAFMIGMICVAFAIIVSDSFERHGRRAGIRVVSPFFTGSFITFTYGLIFSFIYY